MSVSVTDRVPQTHEDWVTLYRGTLGEERKDITIKPRDVSEWGLETIARGMFQSWYGINPKLQSYVMTGVQESLDWLTRVAPHKKPADLGPGLVLEADRIRSTTWKFNLNMPGINGPRSGARLAKIGREVREEELFVRGQGIEFHPSDWADPIKRRAVMMGVIGLGRTFRQTICATGGGHLLNSCAKEQDFTLFREGAMPLRRFLEEWNRQNQETFGLQKQGAGFGGLLSKIELALQNRGIASTNFVTLPPGIANYLTEFAHFNQYMDDSQKPLRAKGVDYLNPANVVLGRTKNGGEVFENRNISGVDGIGIYNEFVRWKEFGQFFQDIGNQGINANTAHRYSSEQRTVRIWDLEKSVHKDLTAIEGLRNSSIYHHQTQQMTVRGAQIWFRVMFWNKNTGGFYDADSHPCLVDEKSSSSPSSSSKPKTKAKRRPPRAGRRRRRGRDSSSDESSDSDDSGSDVKSGMGSNSGTASKQAAMYLSDKQGPVRNDQIVDCADIELLRLYYLAKSQGDRVLQTMIHGLRRMDARSYQTFREAGRCDLRGASQMSGSSSQGQSSMNGGYDAKRSKPPSTSSGSSGGRPLFRWDELDDTRAKDAPAGSVDITVVLPINEGKGHFGERRLPLPALQLNGGEVEMKNHVVYQTGPGARRDMKKVFFDVLNILDDLADGFSNARSGQAANDELNRILSVIMTDDTIRSLWSNPEALTATEAMDCLVSYMAYDLARKSTPDVKTQKEVTAAIFKLHRTWDDENKNPETPPLAEVKKEPFTLSEAGWRQIDDIRTQSSKANETYLTTVDAGGGSQGQQGQSEAFIDILVPEADKEELKQAAQRLSPDNKKYLSKLAKNYKEAVIADALSDRGELTPERKRLFKATVAAWIREGNGTLDQIDKEFPDADIVTLVAFIESQPDRFLSQADLEDAGVAAPGAKKRRRLDGGGGDGGGDGDGDGDELSSRAKRSVATVVADMKAAKLEFRMFQVLWDNNVIMPFNIEYLRPWTRSAAGWMLGGLGGEDSAVTTIVDAMTLLDLSPTTKTNEISFEAKATTLTRDPRKFYAIPAVCSMGKIQGGGCTFFHATNLAHLQSIKRHDMKESMFAQIVPYTFEYDNTVLNICGKFNPAVVLPADQPSHNQTPTARIYAEMFGFHYEANHPLSLRACAIDKRGENTYCTIGSHWRYVPHGSKPGAVIQEFVAGQDPLGRTEYKENIEVIRSGAGHYQQLSGAMPQQAVYGPNGK